MHTRKVVRLALPAVKTVKLALSGIHLMLLQLKKPLRPGDSVALDLTVVGKADGQNGVHAIAPVRAAPPGQAMIAKALGPVALALALVACSDRAGPPSPLSPFKSTDISSVDWGQDFHLTDHNGRPRSIADFKGKVVMLFFGFTHCPDVCPTTLAEMAQVRNKLGDHGQRLQGLFVTIDPQRDTPQVLTQYAPAFDPSFLGLYGNKDITAALAREFKLFYSAQKPDAEGNYTVDHSSVIYVFDPRGHLRLMMRPGTGIDAMAADVTLLLKGK